MEKYIGIITGLATIYSRRRIPRASAALSYYLTMTVFPLAICLYALLGQNYFKALETLEFMSEFFSDDATAFIRNFLLHVASDSSRAMLVAGLFVLISSSSGAIRTIQATIGEMQGGQRYHGIMYFAFSIVFSVLFLAAMYFSVVVIIFGQVILNRVNALVPHIDISNSWIWLRFIILAAIMFCILWGVYFVAKRQQDKYDIFPGALLATAGTVAMSAAFSVFIGESSKYSLVYGSLASLILLMLWLYIFCQIIYIGAAFNIVLRDLQ